MACRRQQKNERLQIWSLMLAWLFLLVCKQPLNAQERDYYFRHYQVEQGLSNNTIFSALQSEDGFLWFGTKEGLNRFDGYNFKLFLAPKSNKNEIKTNYIYSLSKDDNGQIWVGAEHGLYKVDERNESLLLINNSLKDIHKVIQAGEHRYWILSQHSVYLYDTLYNKLVTAQFTTRAHATAMAKTTDGSIWVGDEYGKLFVYRAADSVFVPYQESTDQPSTILKRINKLVATSGNELFICTAGQGIKKLNVSSGKLESLISYNEDKTPVFGRDVLEVEKDCYWLATESGIFIYKPSNKAVTNLKKAFFDPYSLSDNAVYNLTKDLEGGIWAGTFFGGVNYYPKQYHYFQKFYPTLAAPSITGNSVREIREDKYNNIWIGTEDGGLNKLDPASGNTTGYRPTGKKTDISYSNIHGLLVDGDTLWVGTFEHGLDLLDIKTGKVIKHYNAGTGEHDLKSNFVLTIIKHSSGNIYLGTGNGLYRYRRQTDDFEHVKGIPISIFISILKEDHLGKIWAGTHGNGIYYYNPITTETGHYADKNRRDLLLSQIFVNDIFEDVRNHLWIATEGGGLLELNKERKIDTIFRSEHGFPANYVFKTLQDNTGVIWVTTSKGLVQLDTSTKKITVLTKENGLLNNQFNYSSGLKDHAGNIYFGSIKGMIRFHPESFKENKYKPPIYITGLQVHNQEIGIDSNRYSLKQSILYTNEITLPYDQSSISIDVAALSYTSPEVTTYKYIMQGLDDQWTQLEKNRRIYYTNLAPGTYRFKVVANAFNNNVSDTKELKIHILPPIWATGWAYLIYVLAGSALIGYLIVTYHNRTQAKKSKEIYESKIDFFTNVAHEIKTPLTLIKGPVENLAEKTAEYPAIFKDVSMLERNTNRLINLVQQILDFRQTEARNFSITLEKLEISAILEEVFDDFKIAAEKKQISFKLYVNHRIYGYADEDALRKIFSNLLSNAVKYASKEASVELKRGAGAEMEWMLEIKNDGHLIPEAMKEKIFEPFVRLKESVKHKGTGIGLSLARSLAELHDGQLLLIQNGPVFNVFLLKIPTNPNK